MIEFEQIIYITMDKLLSLTIDLRIFCNKILDNYRNRKSLDFPKEHLFIHYLERLEANLDSVRILIPELADNQKIEHSIGLILRSNMADFFTIIYISMGKLHSEKKWIDRICIVNYDQTKHIRKDLTISFKNGWLTKEQQELGLSKIEKDYSFMKNLTELDLDDQKNKLPGSQKITEEMLKNTNMKSLARGYELFKYYSQYEHYGFITSIIKNVDFSTDLDRIKRTLYYSCSSLNFIIMNLELWEYLEEGKVITSKFE